MAEMAIGHEAEIKCPQTARSYQDRSTLTGFGACLVGGVEQPELAGIEGTDSSTPVRIAVNPQ
jgi:hypothetical protein